MGLLIIILLLLIAIICYAVPLLRNMIGILLLIGIVFLVIGFFVQLWKEHTIGTNIRILLVIVIFVAFAFVFLRTLIFGIAWFGS